MWSTESLAWPICFYLAPFCSGTRKARRGAVWGSSPKALAYRPTNLLPFLQRGVSRAQRMAAMYWPNPGKSYRTLVKAQAVNGWPSLSSGICQAEACRGN